MSHIIKFTHTYAKLTDLNGRTITYAKLLDVIPRKIEDVSAELIEWDTDHGTYQLPKKGEYLMLVFQKPGKRDLFCTFRRSTPGKEDYYRKCLGEIFYIEINDQDICTVSKGRWDVH